MIPIRSGLLVLVAAGAAGCSSPPPPRAGAPGGAPIAVSVARVEAADLPAQFEAGGVVRARLTAALSSRVLAPVLEVRVRPGDRIRRGQPLIVLDGRALRAQSVGARASIDAARQTARAVDADVQAADAGLALARATHDRIAGLHAKKSATAQELDEAVAGLRAAEARLAGAQAHAREAASALAAAEAAGDAADVTASYSTLSAPFDGVVTDRSIDPGAVAAPGLPLLTVEDMSGYRLEVRLDEARAAGVTLGSPASVRLDTATERSSSWIPARVSEIARLDPTAHSFVAKLDLPSGAGLRSGLFGRARFEGAPRRATAAPATALVRRGQVTFVFVATGDTARLRPVSVGQPVDDRVEILAGLSAGESVVVNPPAELTDGSRLATTGVRMDPASERRGAAPAGARP